MVRWGVVCVLWCCGVVVLCIGWGNSGRQRNAVQVIARHTGGGVVVKMEHTCTLSACYDTRDLCKRLPDDAGLCA